ncbi:MAG: DUF2157 domain-containing protein [Azoarcus sp.]|nr:DUF2157 domain-containing protein [Azoarcus sp.]
MTESNRVAAQGRTDDIRGFRAELQRLQAEGVLQLSGEQTDAVQAHHAVLLSGFLSDFDVDPDTRSQQLSWGMRIASLLGALAFAASVFFLFYRFWGIFPETAQVAILIGASLGTFVLTLWVDARDRSGYFTKLAAFAAFACFVLNTVMLGQIFNITPSDKALLPWAAFALLLAYHCDLRLMLAAGIVCIVAYVAARVGSWSGVYWIHFGERPENFIPLSIALIGLSHWVSHRGRESFPPTYRLFGMLSLLLPVLVLANWGAISYLPWSPATVEAMYQIAGFVLSAAAIWAGMRMHWPEVVNTGIVFFVVFMYTKLFDWWWELMPKYLFFLVLGLCSVLALLVVKRLRGVQNAGGVR